ncbi:Microtubule-binding stalk of dynein motor/ATP-binding dynein motor region/Dynein heavy chain region D6 P-loop domain/Dynein heavy chain AAA lid domain/Dynein heavy chain C-terminal domain containing protein, putative [Angomonas deanei]|uniref:Uncharacterized protein n=1 Tax=Angomonas deanei TaxID=59799 RepID=A0A7G2C9U5_9TRYP|nr:Microtubule-binding stalk of dynein motor/ATP-binding dynein motor region/Dynein heavy chain region D6 P-loop domain/Dynein heavy chain AAA lid domain/Dynein heavy chain C-terminal domain containing protein, putative [Angomonas deanei]
MWVLAINNYYEVVKVVAPKRERLKEAEAKVAVATQTLQEAQGRLKEIEDKLAALKRDMEDNISKKKQLEDDIDLTTVRLERAEQLMSGLSSEQSRWTTSIEKLQEEKGGLVGRIALAAGFVAYLGPFTSTYREQMLSTWYNKCVELSLPVGNSAFDLQSVVDPVVVRSWAQQGLPTDAFSIENGITVNKSNRWCLCIDPQGQAVNWIRNKERENNLRIIKLSDNNYMRTLENAIRMGLPVLLENVEESLDAALDSVLLRQTYRSQGRLLLKLGDSEVDYDPNFRFYITTKLPNPSYLPELQIKVTIVNFTVTPIGLANQLLADVVRYEFAELEQRADKTVLDISNGKNELKQTEDKILHLLTSFTGNILDNEQLVNTLQGAKVTSESVSEALRVAEETQKDIEIARNRYRPVARRGSVVYSVISDLAGLDHMYQNSLEFFKTLFTLTLQQTEKKDVVEERVAVLLPAVTLRSYKTICRGLFERDKLVFAFLLFSGVTRQDGVVREDEWNFFLKGSDGRKYADPDTDPSPTWMPAVVWNEVTALSQVLPEFKTLRDDILDNESEWKQWYENDKAYAEYPTAVENFTSWRQLLVLRVFREDLLNYGMPLVITESLGKEFTESPAFDLEGCFTDSTPSAPIVFILTPGTDPTQLFSEFAERKGFASRKLMLSLGQDQGGKAAEMIRRGSTEGLWVYLQNCHVYTSWIPSLERILEEITQKEIHRDFRLWLTTMPVATFPVLLLQSCVKVVKEPPKGLKANLRDTLAMNVTDDIWNDRPQNATVWKRMILSLTYFHAVIQERRRFGPLGWNIAYEWNQSDYKASLMSLDAYIGADEPQLPWDALRYMVGVINYGGRVTDFLDTRCLNTILKGFFDDGVLEPKQFNITQDGVYHIPSVVDTLSEIHESLAELPPFEGPELFGLHSNADITFNKTAARRQLQSMRAMQPRRKGAVGATPEDNVLQIVTEFERRLPELIDREAAHPDTYRLTEDGTMISLGTVAGQEIDVFNGIILKLRRLLTQLKRGIKGVVVMSVELEEMFDSILAGQVPESWSAGSYLSRKPLASWFDDTLNRVEFFRDWNDNGAPLSFWISGFFFPQGFLTGVLQTYCRDNKVPIDDVKFKTNLTHYEQTEDIPNELKAPGVYIHGLFLEGAGLDIRGGHLVESRKGELYFNSPVIHLEPVRSSVQTATDSTYVCPVYKTSARVGTLSTTGLSTNFVTSLEVQSGSQGNPQHWIKRGVAFLCMLDD